MPKIEELTVTDINEIRKNTLVFLADDWGQHPSRKEKFAGFKGLVPLHGVINVTDMGDLNYARMTLILDGQPARFNSESPLTPVGATVDKDLALGQLSAAIGYLPASAKVVSGEYLGERLTHDRRPIETLDFSLICVSVEDYEELRKRKPGILVQAKTGHHSAEERGTARYFKEEAGDPVH